MLQLSVGLGGRDVRVNGSIVTALGRGTAPSSAELALEHPSSPQGSIPSKGQNEMRYWGLRARTIAEPAFS